jgi:hypothetical protein
VFGIVALTACGGDDDAPSGDNGNTEETAAATGGDGEADPTDEPTEGDDGDEPAHDGDEPAGDAVAASDVCTLVTQSEAEAAVGDAVQTPVVTYTGTASVSGTAPAEVGTCSYVAPAGIPSVSVNYWSAPGADEAILQMTELACDGKEMIDGLGDAACWYDDGHVEIQFGQGSSFVDIFVTMEGDASEALLAISHAAAGRLP